MNPLADLGLAWLLDRVVGDPHRLPHPVSAIGALVRFLEVWLRRVCHHELSAGVLLVMVVVGATVGTVGLSLRLASLAGPLCWHAVQIYWIFAALAGTSLEREARKVLRALPDLVRARRALSMLVTRDCSAMDEAQVCTATVETVAENTVDGVLSPLLFVCIGLPFGLAAPLVWAFKAVSTMDSMVGYRTERYERFGKAAARLDDAANFPAARISLFLIPLAALFCGLDAPRSLATALRDRRKHASPNSAHPEAAFAGALGIGFGGPVNYGGKVEHKEIVGLAMEGPDGPGPDGVRPVPASPATLKAALRLLAVTSLLALVLSLGILAGMGMWQW